jgi:predicted AAA+ superfamily ATPase
MKFDRAIVGVLKQAILKTPEVIHAVVGPRQVGKTTAVRKVCAVLGWKTHWAAADSPFPPGAEWIESHWAVVSALAASQEGPVLLVLDEIQKVRGWSEVLKRLWDEAVAHESPIRVVILGSSALLVQSGLSESLSGRFYLHRCMHWDWEECRQAFGWSLRDWLYFGGYPGGARFAEDESVWRQYISDSMIETVLTRDVMQLAPVTKPVLMRHLFGLAAQYPAQMLSYTKMVGQLQDAGNTTTLAHYLKLLQASFLLSGLELYSAGQLRQRGSSPKLVFWNNALIHAQSGLTREMTENDPAWQGRIVENAVGVHLLNHLIGAEWTVCYWRSGNLEMDYVIQNGQRVYGIEVKSGKAGKCSGCDAFRARYPKAAVLVVGSSGIPLETFFGRKPQDLLS